MATVVFALPVHPGKEAVLRAFIDECTGPRYAEFDASERRIGVAGESWHLLRVGDDQLFTFVVTGPDLDATFAAFIASRDPFDLWFKQCTLDTTGIDLNAGPPPTAMIAETLAAYPR